VFRDIENEVENLGHTAGGEAENSLGRVLAGVVR
jgi:hypothetical protein